MDSSSESRCALTDGSASEYLSPADSIASVSPMPIISASDDSSSRSSEDSRDVELDEMLAVSVQLLTSSYSGAARPDLGRDNGKA